jgi:macrodomain Ter protein organizer (MatP/YcbG family)
VEDIEIIYWGEHCLNVEEKESIGFKSIKVSEETHSRLAKLGTVGQTFEDVIKSLLDEHEQKAKSKK